MNRRVIRPGDGEWPEQVNELGPETPPTKLYVEGLELTAEKLTTVAVVGARHPTAAGMEAAEHFARGLAEAGFTIVSGLAVGIDAAAHRSALDAGGYTVAVLGCGLDADYPTRNRGLRARIASRGTVVTEYPEGTPPSACHFPERNRIIAGLAEAVVYVEGGTQSGGRITARLALDAGRAVFAVPGSIRNPLAAGPNELIRTSQAALVSDVRHVFEELAPRLAWDGPPALGLDRSVQLDDEEASVLGFLDDVPVTVDRVCRTLGLAPGRASLILSRLEIRGLARRRSTGYQISSSGSSAREAHLLNRGALDE